MFRQFLHFAAIGAVGTAVQYAVLMALVRGSGVYAVTASAVGFVAGALMNYTLNYRFTFRSRKCHREAMAKFFSVALIGLGFNTLVMGLAMNFAGLHYLASQLAATGLVLLWNFAGNRYWTFREVAHAEPRS